MINKKEHNTPCFIEKAIGEHLKKLKEAQEILTDFPEQNDYEFIGLENTIKNLRVE